MVAPSLDILRFLPRLRRKGTPMTETALTYEDLVAECRATVPEVFPADVETELVTEQPPLLLDVREPYEFDALHIPGAINVPRGILEAAADWGYEDTVPELAGARDQEVVVICRSGHRSLLAAATLKRMGFADVRSMKTGVRGWDDEAVAFEDGEGNPVPEERVDAELNAGPRPEQMGPR